MNTKLSIVICVIFLVIYNVSCNPNKKAINDILELSVVHFNDFHARFEESSSDGSACKEELECIGGFSRMYQQIMTILNDKPNSILLNAGDNFQGTLWYTVGKWNVTQQFMNMLPIDAEVLGNHEFDDGIDGIVPYIKALQHPIVVSNIDHSEEPKFEGIYQKSTIVERNGKRIGIIGVITKDCPILSSTGKLIFSDESASVNAEAERLKRYENVDTIIVLSHSGYDVEQKIAKNATDKISLVVGGHSHSFLWTGDNPPGPDTPAGPYPTIVQSVNGHKVLVTQASAYSRFIGNITIYIDDSGEIVDYSGAPIYLDHSLPQNALINEDLKPWKQKVDEIGDVVVGSSLVKLSNEGCYNNECVLGNFVTDAMVFAYTKTASEDAWTESAIAIANSGSLRTTINRGNITYNDMVTSQPFGNTIDYGEIQGKYLKELMESATDEYVTGRVTASLKLLQVSGLVIHYDLSKPIGERIITLKARCQNCTVPIYEDVEMEKMYSIALPSFLSNGGDGFDVLVNNLVNKRIGRLDMDVFMDYLTSRSPIFQEEGGRIFVYNNTELVSIRR